MKSAASTTTSYGTIEVTTSGYTYEFRVNGYVRAAGTLRAGPEAVVVDDLKLDNATGTATLGGKDFPLTPTQQDILAKLMSEPTRHFTKRDLIPAGEVKHHLYRLRRKLGNRYIHNRPNVGWRLLP